LPSFISRLPIFNTYTFTHSTRRWLPLIGAVILASIATIVVTWPQFLAPTKVVDHFDPYFSVWRLGHIAHALKRWPIALFDANIFYPAKGTLAYSDATLLEGVLAAPLFWAGVAPTLIYNVLLYAGFVLSGAAIFVLARHLTRSIQASFIAVVIFVMLPYRVEHLMHLELQWAAFIPLTFWAMHRTAESGRWRDAVLAGLFTWLQFVACIYYGVFLALVLLLFAPLLLLLPEQRSRRSFILKMSVCGAVTALLVLPYLWPYYEASRVVGVRRTDEIVQFSARLTNYFATSEWNRLWGWTADRWGAMELRLFPGAIALALAAASLFHRRWRHVAIYAVVVGIAVELSLGLNGSVYGPLLEYITPLRAFRAVARFAIIVGFGVAMLAAFGAQALLRATPRPMQRWLGLALIVLLFIEYSNRDIPLVPGVAAKPADAYRVLKDAEKGAIVELPLPDMDLSPRPPGFDPYYQAWSVWHWRPLVNGYSGFTPAAYEQFAADLKGFPDDRSVKALRTLQVRYVLVHQAFYPPADYADLALKLATSSALTLWGTYKDPVGSANIIEVAP
jgi:hypothetical protein